MQLVGNRNIWSHSFWEINREKPGLMLASFSGAIYNRNIL